MLAEYKSKTNIFVGLGIVLEILGRVVGGPVGGLITLVGAVLFIVGCWNYALGKGYPGPVGLLGLLSCIGLLILVILPDRNNS